MRLTCYSCRKLLRGGKIIQFLVAIFLLIMVAKIYTNVNEVQVIEEEEYVKVEKKSIVIIEYKNSSVQKLVKSKLATQPIVKTTATLAKVTKSRPKSRPKKLVDKSIKYTLAGFKRYLNMSKPTPLDHRDLTYLLQPTEICTQKLDFVIIVHSASKNADRRNVLRFTIGKYAQQAKLKYKMMFVTGVPLDNANSQTADLLREHTEFSDLLVMDNIDSYRNMTYKAVSWMKWITEFCDNKPEYILKIDDDALIKLPLLIDMLRPCNRSKKGAICRQISCLVRPREPSLRYGKNKITFDEYPFKHYPPMCPGLMYLMPGSFAESMLAATQKVPFIWLDDVYVTIFLRVYMNEKLNSLRRFFMQPHDKNFKQLYAKKMVAHLQSKTFITDYIKIWNEMLKSYKPA